MSSEELSYLDLTNGTDLIRPDGPYKGHILVLVRCILHSLIH
jgi:hypothetical protein